MSKKHGEVESPETEVVDCIQRERILRIEQMQSGLGSMVKEVCKKVDALRADLEDVLFPSKLHPSDGLIPRVQKNSKEIGELKEKVQEYEKANVIVDLQEVKTEISKFKTWVTAVVTIAVALFSVITLILQIIFK